jgi:hypothetical protein
MYNLDVEDYHTFFVGKTGTLVKALQKHPGNLARF